MRNCTDRTQTKGMTLEDISVLFGDPVELSFEQAMSKQDGGETEDAKAPVAHVESVTAKV